MKYTTIESVFNTEFPLWTDTVTRDYRNTALIICSEKGTLWMAQTDGLSTITKEARGFCINLGNFLQHIDSCFCKSGGMDVKKFAAELNKEFESTKKKYFSPFTLTFKVNREKINELCEGWFPVKIVGHCYYPEKSVFFKADGYIHTGNCD